MNLKLYRIAGDLTDGENRTKDWVSETYTYVITIKTGSPLKKDKWMPWAKLQNFTKLQAMQNTTWIRVAGNNIIIRKLTIKYQPGNHK